MSRMSMLYMSVVGFFFMMVIVACGRVAWSPMEFQPTPPTQGIAQRPWPVREAVARRIGDVAVDDYYPDLEAVALALAQRLPSWSQAAYDDIEASQVRGLLIVDDQEAQRQGVSAYAETSDPLSVIDRVVIFLDDGRVRYTSRVGQEPLPGLHVAWQSVDFAVNCGAVTVDGQLVPRLEQEDRLVLAADGWRFQAAVAGRSSMADTTVIRPCFAAEVALSLQGTMGAWGDTPSRSGSISVPGRRGQAGQDGRSGQDGSNGNPGSRPGANGQNGRHGTDGAPGARGGDGHPGNDGLAGRNGGNGQRGQDSGRAQIQVRPLVSSFDDQYLMRIDVEHSRLGQRLLVVPWGHGVPIDARGGDGGRGGNGQRGMSGGVGGAGGAGGDGGAGGNGGRGGQGARGAPGRNATQTTQAGSGGKGGDGGNGGNGGDGGNGARGGDGATGGDGGRGGNGGRGGDGGAGGVVRIEIRGDPGFMAMVQAAIASRQNIMLEGGSPGRSGSGGAGGTGGRGGSGGSVGSAGGGGLMGRGGMPGQGGPGGRGYSWQEPVERQVWTPQGTVTQTQFVRRSHPAGNMGPMGSMGDMGEAGTSGQAGGRGVDGRSGADGPGGREGPPGNRGSDGSLNVVLRQEAMSEQEASSEPEEDPVWSEHRYEAMVYIPGADQGIGVTVVAETRHRWVMLLPDGQQRSFAKRAVLVMPVDRP